MGEDRQERWALSEADEARIDALNSNDELFGTWVETDTEGHPVGDTHVVVIQRNGVVTNRYRDGTIGVPEHVRALLESEDALYHPLDGESEIKTTAKWVDVFVGPDGSFKGLVPESPAP